MEAIMELLTGVYENPIVWGLLSGCAWTISCWARKADEAGKMIDFDFARLWPSLIIGGVYGVMAQVPGVEIESLVTDVPVMFAAVGATENGGKTALRHGWRGLIGAILPLLSKLQKKRIEKKK